MTETPGDVTQPDVTQPDVTVPGKPVTAAYRLAALGLLLAVTAALGAADQAVKRWAYRDLRPVGERPIIDGLIGFTYVENRGAAFGILQNARWFLLPLTVAFFIFITISYLRIPRTRKSWAARIPMMLIAAGAAGNFIDRLRTGYVIDMFEFKFITFPVFNVADALLVCGTFVFAFVMLFVFKDFP